jgi:hypothetical protein
MKNVPNTPWLKSNTQSFWDKIAPCSHMVQFYEDNDALLNSLEGFVSGGIQADETVIVIATPLHLHSLEKRLKQMDVNVVEAILKHKYIPVDAESALSKFMVNGLPDEVKFLEFLSDLLALANGRKIRAFGEMVALLYQQGNKEATIRLELLWNAFCHSGALSLFCAYPKDIFGKEKEEDSLEICDAHSTVISSWSPTEIFYKSVEH